VEEHAPPQPVPPGRQAEIELVTSHLLLEEYYFDLGAHTPPGADNEGAP
jgi:hypothetical protein